MCPDASPAGVSKCLSNIAQWGLVPFLAGDAVKMTLVAIAVPMAWAAVVAWHKWRGHEAVVAAAEEPADAGAGGASSVVAVDAGGVVAA